MEVEERGTRNFARGEVEKTDSSAAVRKHLDGIQKPGRSLQMQRLRDGWEWNSGRRHCGEGGTNIARAERGMGAFRRRARGTKQRTRTRRNWKRKGETRGEVAFCGLSRAYVISDSTSKGAGPARLSWSLCAHVVEERDGKHGSVAFQTRTRDFQRRGDPSSSSSSSSHSHG